PHLIFVLSLWRITFFCSLRMAFRWPTKVTTTCCTHVSRSPFTFPLKGYRIQNALSPCVHAIVFYREKGGMICTDPKASWVSRKTRGQQLTYTKTLVFLSL
uniref:Chemokine interleukin-8-like domain-containing protein n=1 Tax=Esox lucius TaxID=8010 RepID=A0AAY5JVP9_ESOLU